MKNQIFSSCFFALFLISNSVLYSQGNEATIFELADTDANSVATEVHRLLQDRAEYPGFPSQNTLKLFFEDPFGSPHVIFDQSNCEKPGVRVYKNPQGKICFRFDNLTNSINGNLVVGRLNYADPSFPISFVIYGNVLNTGIDLPEKDLHCEVFVIGYLCPSLSPTGPQLANKFEILIVDKNIL